jgi:hypothetical protein
MRERRIRAAVEFLLIAAATAGLAHMLHASAPHLIWLTVPLPTLWVALLVRDLIKLRRSRGRAVSVLPPHQLRQLGDVGRDAPRLVTCEQVRRPIKNARRYVIFNGSAQQYSASLETRGINARRACARAALSLARAGVSETSRHLRLS